MKKILISVLFLTFVLGVSAQSLQDFEYSPGNGFEKDLTGGEDFTQEINFSNTAGRPVPLALEIRVDGENFPMSSSGDEFDLSDSFIRIDDYSVYDYWNAVSGDLGGPSIKVLELDDSREGVPEEILVVEDTCTGPDENHRIFSLEDEDWSCDFENISGIDSSNLSAENRPEYDRDVVEGSISQDLLSGDQPDLFSDFDNSTVVPVLHDDALTDVEEDTGVDISDYSLVPARFDLSADVIFRDNSYERENGIGLYRFPEESSLMISDSTDISIKVVFDSSVRIRPDSYSFEFDVRSDPGFTSDRKSRDIENGSATVEVEDKSITASVDVRSEKDSASVTVESYEETAVSPPELDNGFVGGVGVEVTKNGNEVESSGNISISYDEYTIEERGLNEDSMMVYYFNESRAEWTTEGVEVISRDTENNVIRAEASHFSVYAAFTEKESKSPDESSNSEWIDWTSESSEENHTEDVTTDNTTEDDTGLDPSDMEEESKDSQSTGDQQENSSEQTSENITKKQEEVDETPRNQVTGLFSGQPSDATLPLLAAVLISLLIYFRGENLKGLYADLKKS